MEFAKLSSPSLKELFVQELETKILSGQLAVGDRLPPERELAETMQVSRAVVNAGVKELAAKGFLDIQPRVGITVADHRRNGTVDTMLAIMKYNGNRLRGEEVRSILEIKYVLDTLDVQLAIPRMTEADIALLRGYYADMLAQTEPEGIAQAVFAVYHELAFLSGNTLVPLIYNSFRVPVLNLWAQYIRKIGADAVRGTIRGLLQAIEQQDVDAAVQRIQKTVGEAIAMADEIYAALP